MSHFAKENVMNLPKMVFVTVYNNGKKKGIVLSVSNKNYHTDTDSDS